MKQSMLVVALLVMTGCVSLGGRKSSFQLFDENGKLIGRVESVCQSDGKCKYQDAKTTVEIDNRGPLGQVWAAATASLGKVYEAVKEETK